MITKTFIKGLLGHTGMQTFTRFNNRRDTIDRLKLLTAASSILRTILGVKRSAAESLADSYASSDLAGRLPTVKFPLEARVPDHIYQAVRDELMLDGISRQNLATFSQTWLEPQVHRLMDDCIDKNMIDKHEYPQTAEIEARCVRMLADLWNAPDCATTLGCSTTGSSEAAMLGGLAMIRRWREKAQAKGGAIDRPNLVAGPVQVCWHKFARYWDIELREIPMARGWRLMTPEEVISRCDANTIGVVPTFGVTFTGEYEPVQAVAAALDSLQSKTGLDIPIHVDGASGGFLAPFCAPEIVWDFRIPRVKSINSSGHKYGLAPLGVGWVVWREAKDLPKELIFNVNYLGGDMPTFALNFSRPGGQIISQYYNFLRLGKAGYREAHDSCYATARFLADELRKSGPFDILFGGDPKTGIPAVSWTLQPDSSAKFDLYDLGDRLRATGWQVPAYSLKLGCQDLVVQRILVRRGFSMDLAQNLITDMKRALAYLEAHPRPR